MAYVRILFVIYIYLFKKRLLDLSLRFLMPTVLLSWQASNTVDILNPSFPLMFAGIMMTQSKGKHFPRYWQFVRGIHRSQRPVTRSFDVFFDMHPNKRLSKQSWGWRFETPAHPLWRHCNGYLEFGLHGDVITWKRFPHYWTLWGDCSDGFP